MQRFSRSLLTALSRGVLLALLITLANAHGTAAAQAEFGPPEASERNVKAAYILRFLPYVQWPAEAFQHAGSPIVIAMVGADDVAEVLESLVPGRLVQNRPLQVRRVAPGDSMAGVHVLYVGRASNSRSVAATRALGSRGVLTITDVDNGLERGGIINFVMSEGRVRFEVAADNTDRSGLKLSSRLLAVAMRVRSGD